MTDTIVATTVVEDLLTECDPDLDLQPAVYTRALAALLQPAIENVVQALRTPGALQAVCDRERSRLAICPITAQALELFIANMVIGD
jgi:hypothetical protein